MGSWPTVEKGKCGAMLGFKGRFMGSRLPFLIMHGTMNRNGRVSPFQGSIYPFGLLPGVPLCYTPGYHITGFQPSNYDSWRTDCSTCG
jgi:hypothetical protein